MSRVDEFCPALVGFLANAGGQSFFEIEEALLVVLNVHDVFRNAANAAAIPQLLLVPLDDRGRTYLGLIRILAELAPRFPLAQQIPTLIELDLDGFQPYLIVIGQFALPVKMLLLVNKTFDLLQDGVIGRRFSHGHHLAHAP